MCAHMEADTPTVTTHASTSVLTATRRAHDDRLISLYTYPDTPSG